MSFFIIIFTSNQIIIYRYITTGNNNIAIGADVYDGAWSNQVAIGNIAHIVFPATTTQADVWWFFDVINPYGGNEPCIVSATNFHANRYYKNNTDKTIKLYNSVGNVIMTISNSQSTLGEEVIITCHKL